MIQSMSYIHGRESCDGSDFFNISGTKLNTSRTLTSPLPARDVFLNVTGHSSQDDINLYNFERLEYAESRYVLTSPRSLEACSRLNIKPVELVYRPLLEYQEDLEQDGVPLRQIFNLYDREEASRQKKLKLCREERQRIIEDDLEAISPRQKSPIITGGRTGHVESVTLSAKSSLKEKPTEDGDTGSFNSGRLQRNRTAWNTSIGHTRVTNDELNKRAREIYESGKLAYKSPSPSGPRKSSSQPNISKKRSRSRSRKRSSQSRSSSCTDVSLSPSGTWSRRPSSVDARPITNTRLRKSLSSASGRYLGTKIPSQDQKILELMMNKREEEKRFYEERENAKLEWEERKRSEIESKKDLENKRRKSLQQIRQLKEQNKLEDLERRKQQLDAEKEDMRRSLELSQQQWEQLLKHQNHIKEQKLRDKKLRDIEKKKTQEELLRSQEEAFKEFQQLVSQKLDHDIRRAVSKKEAKEHEELRARKIKNYYSQKKHSERKSDLDRRASEELASLHDSLDAKLTLAQNNYKKVQQTQDKQLQRQQHDRVLKHRKTLATKGQMEDEMEAWHEDLLQYRQLKEDEAERKSRNSIHQRAQRASEDRARREREHREKLEKIQQEEQAIKQEQKGVIAYKDIKSRAIQEERDRSIQQSRAMAHASQQLREELKKKYSTDSFDKMVKQTQLEAKIVGSTPGRTRTASKNTSKLHLG